jgi:hypothetical protein
MGKELELKKGITLTIPLTGYPRSMRYNRFALESAKPILLLHFGFVTPQGMLVDKFSCVMAVADLKLNRESTVSYLDRISEVPDVRPENWLPPTPAELPMVRIVASCHTGENAELSLCTFSQAASINMSQSSAEKGKVHVAQPLALLASDATLQKHVLTRLFLEKHV